MNTISNNRRWLAGGAVLVAAISVSALVGAKHRAKSSTTGSVGLVRNQMSSSSKNVVRLKDHAALRRVDVEFECPSGYKVTQTVLHTAHGRYEVDVGINDKRRLTRQFHDVKVASKAELINACLSGQARVETEIRAQATCYKGGTAYFRDVTTRNTKLPVTLNLSCEQMLRPGEMSAGVREKSFRHECPSGYVIKNDGRPFIVSSRWEPLTCEMR